MMEKMYRLLDWLTLEQAVDWLNELTGTPVTSAHLLQLCEAQQCAVYADVGGLISNELGFDAGMAKGIHLVTNPFEAFGSEWRPREIWTRGDTFTQVGAALLFDEIPAWKRAPIFQPADIQALAAKMNGTAEYAAEVEVLRQQLEQKRVALDAAENELLERRAEAGQKTLDNMRHALMHDHQEFSAMQTRAEQAERIAASTAAQLAELSERQQRDTILIAQMTERLVPHEKGELPITETETPTTSLIFPYATKELRVIQAAALRYWADYTPDKRQPTQKEIGLEIDIQLGRALRSDSEPSRKAKNLATAIKPDSLPDI